MPIRLTIDGREVEVQPGATILDAARRLDVRIPTLCHMDGLEPATACLLCLVQVKGRKRLVPSCTAPAEEGTVVVTDSEAVRESRRTALELLLSDHRGDCVAPCSMACPTGLDVPGFVAHLAAGENRQAIELIKERMALPAVLGRICPRYCERVCRRRESEEAVAIRALHRFAADTDLASPDPYVPERAATTGKRVAILGSGPAALSAAFYLLRDGHACVVLESQSEPGGTLRYGLADPQLPKEVLDGEIEIIRRLGAEFCTGRSIDPDAEMDALLEEHDAVFVTTGPRTSARGTFQTERPGVFALGDADGDTGAIVRAVAAGRQAALCVSQYLARAEVQPEPRPFNVRMGKLSEEDRAELLKGIEKRPRGFQETPDGLTDELACREAERCLQCDCAARDDCKLRLYSAEYGADPRRFPAEPRPFVREEGGLIVYEPGKCILCGLCVRIAASRGERLGLGFARRGFGTHVAVPFGRPLAQMTPATLKLCAEACPTGALSLSAAGQPKDAETPV